MKECCQRKVITPAMVLGDNHHATCERYYDEKNPYLFYYEEACNSFIIAPRNLNDLLSVNDMYDGEEMEIKFRRSDLTDKEYAELPEV